ncbi:MAG: capsular biosynthesis protein [Prevotella sp.]|nr:capsular biosynthesis protein [Prevotella sp.]
MFFLNKKYTLTESGFLNDWTDRHSHILPGVDDGIRTMEDSLSVLKFYEQAGVSTVWLTPHIMEDVPNEPAELKERFEELKEAYRQTEGEKKINLHLAAENMIDPLFVKRLEAGNLLTYGDKGDELLVETSYAQAPYRFKLILQDIRKAGLTPVLAHPERYRYMDYDDYDTLHEQGVRFQLNITSLAGAYGPEPKERAEYLLEEGYYTYQGSDLHSLSAFKRAINEHSVRKRIYRLLQHI